MSEAFRIALANLRFPATPAESVAKACDAIADAGRRGARLVAFPECYVPGYRAAGRAAPSPDGGFLEGAWEKVARAAATAGVTVVLGTERIVGGRIRASALVIRDDGTREGFQDKVQLDPSEDATYAPGEERRLFECSGITFGVVICHEGWRYPETVRWAARRGAKLVIHQQFHEAEAGAYRPRSYGDPANSFHEKAVLCRAAENSCYFATVNYSSEGSPTTSAVAGPDGRLMAYQPYGEEGLLVVDIDPDAATLLLASRLRTTP